MKIGDFVLIKYWDHADINAHDRESFKDWKGLILEDIGRVEIINKRYVILSQTIENPTKSDEKIDGCGILRKEIISVTNLVRKKNGK